MARKFGTVYHRYLWRPRCRINLNVSLYSINAQAARTRDGKVQTARQIVLSRLGLVLVHPCRNQSDDRFPFVDHVVQENDFGEFRPVWQAHGFILGLQGFHCLVSCIGEVLDTFAGRAIRPMAIVVGGGNETVRDVDMCEFLREFFEQFRGRVDRVGFVDGDEGGVVAHCRSAMAID